MKTSLLLLLTIGISTGSAPAVTAKTPAAPPSPPCCREGLPPAKFSEKSIYSISDTWTADVGKEVKLDAMRGRPQVVAMIFTNCQHSCPFIVKEMKAIEKGLPANIRAQTNYLLVSIDPERDTVDALRAYRAKYNLSLEHWSLLRGSAESVRKLADLIGHRYYPGSNLQYAHSLLISVVSPTGDIVFQQSGLGNSREDAVAAVTRLVNPKGKGKPR